jgi:acyl-CoA thioester hydrolase
MERREGMMPKEFKQIFRVSWSETDAAGIVHFSNYFRYFERAEELFYNEIGMGFERLIRDYEIKLPRIEASCRYLSVCRYNDNVEVSLQITQLDDKKLRSDFKVRNITTGKESAEGSIVNIASNLDVDRSVLLPSDLTQAIGGYFAN